MAGYQLPRPGVLNVQQGRPATPVVDRKLLDPVSEQIHAVQREAFIMPRAVTPEDMSFVGPFSGRICIRMVSRMTGISMIEMTSARRHKEVVRARHIYFWLARRFTPLSFPQIAQICGRRDHTTAIHGCRKVDQHIALNGIKVCDDPKVMAGRLLSIQWSVEGLR